MAVIESEQKADILRNAGNEDVMINKMIAGKFIAKEKKWIAVPPRHNIPLNLPLYEQ